MGGSGGGSSYGMTDRSGDEIREEALRQVERQETTAAINEYLGELLSTFNDRDTDLVGERLDVLVEALDDGLLDVDRLMYGGSVAKHTYVDGLSDIDALVLLSAPAEGDPQALLAEFKRQVEGSVPAGTEVSTGAMALTVKYRDGLEIQLLPAIERSGSILVASQDGSAWRSVRPRKFAEKLTGVNQANGGGVVPATKLAKAVLSNTSIASALSGYHLEAIAVDAFKDYSGSQSRQAMLCHLLDHAATAVLKPTGDISGQSVRIDDHLGPAGSAQRARVSADIRRVVNRFDTASSVDDYRDLFQ